MSEDDIEVVLDKGIMLFRYVQVGCDCLALVLVVRCGFLAAMYAKSRASCSFDTCRCGGASAVVPSVCMHVWRGGRHAVSHLLCTPCSPSHV